MTLFVFARRVIAGMLAAAAILPVLSLQATGAERWITLPDQPDSYASLDVGSIQRMPSGPVSAWVRVEASNRAGMRSLQRMFGAFRGDMADFLYTVDCRTRQFSVSQAKLYQGALTVSEKQHANDAGWQRVDSVGLANEVARQLCGA
jgi:phosphoribosylcarboxyaminoimidazole (NCAIR) mutase